MTGAETACKLKLCNVIGLRKREKNYALTFIGFPTLCSATCYGLVVIPNKHIVNITILMNPYRHTFLKQNEKEYENILNNFDS